MRILPIVLVACGSTSRLPPRPGPYAPVAGPRPHTITSPNGDREDPYYWLRDDTRKDPAVLGYLTAEANYATAMLAPVKQLEADVFAELRGHVKEDDSSVPVFDDGYFTYSKFAPGQEQPVIARKKGSLTAPEEIVLDANELARGHEFYQLGTWHMSRDGHYVAWADDIVGRRQYTLHVKDLTTGKLLPDSAHDISPTIEWANDNATLFYGGKDATTLREDRVIRHRLGNNKDSDVFREPDGQFYVYLEATKSHRYIQITLRATTMDETRLIDADHPEAEPRVALPREKDHLYWLDHVAGKFVIRTNANAKNFRIVEVADGKERDRSQWHDIVPARADQFVDEIAVANHFIAATVRSGGLSKVLVYDGKQTFYIDTPETPSATAVVDLPDQDATHVRYTYTSLVTPPSTYELDVSTRAKTLLKAAPVPSYDASLYTTSYHHATAKDGTLVPVSVVSKKSTKLDGTAPLLVTGYGSYGASSDPRFSSTFLPLLDRGWVVAIAHVRGGQEMGRAWYEDGRQMHKINTFTDFIAATEFLVAQKFGARDQVFARGGSAGGLLMGAILNLRPDLYRGIVAEVPFVDVVTTMLDESIPLTTNEFEEWGNPKQKAAYDYMLSYSPYDNVAARAYPSIYVRTGLWDSQVQYFEPAKWVAKLRATKTDANLVVMDVDMAAGHGGKSGRFDKLKDIARVWAFVLMIHDRPDARRDWPR